MILLECLDLSETSEISVFVKILHFVPFFNCFFDIHFPIPRV